MDVAADLDREASYAFRNRVSQTTGNTSSGWRANYFSFAPPTPVTTSRAVAQSHRGDSAAAAATAITSYNHPDNLGSTNVTSDTGGALAQWLDYAPYGSVLASENTGTTTAARQYIGRFSDASGLSYLNARYYNGTQGQFTSQDPVFLGIPSQQNLQDPQSLNSPTSPTEGVG
jgi:RHS repeat-associated protein